MSEGDKIPWEKQAKYRLRYPVYFVLSLAVSGLFANASGVGALKFWLAAASVGFFAPAVCFAAFAWWAWAHPEDKDGK